MRKTPFLIALLLAMAYTAFPGSTSVYDKKTGKFLAVG
jgi:hypothetical protein